MLIFSFEVSKVSDTVQKLWFSMVKVQQMVSSQISRMLTEEILRNSYSVLSIPVAILKLAARNHLLKILHLNYGNGIPAVIARTDYNSNSQTKTINSTFSMTSSALTLELRSGHMQLRPQRSGSCHRQTLRYPNFHMTFKFRRTQPLFHMPAKFHRQK